MGQWRWGAPITSSTLLKISLSSFRFLNQQADGRREWDLYDPDAKLKDKPARVADDDPRCGPSSIQKFEGEDLNTKARQGYQKEQNREWLDAQVIASATISNYLQHPLIFNSILFPSVCLSELEGQTHRQTPDTHARIHVHTNTPRKPSPLCRPRRKTSKKNVKLRRTDFTT